MKLSSQQLQAAIADLIALLILLALLALLAHAPEARAQAPGGRAAPHLGFAYPAGGRQGTTFAVAVGGQNLTGANAVWISGAGLRAQVVGYERPLTQKEINDLREKLQQLQEKRAAKAGFTAADEQQLAEIRQKLAARTNRQVNPALAETVRLELTLAPDAAPGERELRVQTPAGLSNPLIFCVGQLPEFSEGAMTATTPPAVRPGRGAEPRPAARAQPPLAITLPAVVNGQILPGEVDRLRFAARTGQRLTIAASARALVPYLADAVPGWFQATLALRDASGREVAYNDDDGFNPDPVLLVTIPADGEYTLEIKDALYRGREDFVYRLTVGELPFVQHIFPLGGRTGEELTFALSGWNLSSHTLTVDAADRTPGTFHLSVNDASLRSNPVHIALDAQPECFATEDEAGPGVPQSISLPTIVNGRLERAGDEDVFRFEGRAGTELVAEVTARRLGSPLDSALTLTDATGRRLAFNDDFDDKGAGLLTHQADSRLTATLPADGTYHVRIHDTQGRGGNDYGYRLRVGAPRPDFELRVVPASVSVRAGATVPLTAYALRRDGFEGEILLSLKGAPRGFALQGARIPARGEKVQFTLTAPVTPRDEPYDLTFAGLAVIGGKAVAHAAVPAEDMMQAFAYRHLVPVQEMKVVVAGRSPGFRILTRLPVRIPVGGSAPVRVALPAARLPGIVHFELDGALDGFSSRQIPAGPGLVDVVISCDAAKVQAGLRGNLILQAVGERPAPKEKKNAGAARVPMGTLPAIPFEIVPLSEPPAQ